MAAPSGGIISVRSSVFVATADARFRSSLVLVRITLPETGANPARTLRLTNAAYRTGRWYVDPDGDPWEPILAKSPEIDHGGAWLAADEQPVDAVLSIRDARVSGGGTFSDLFALYPFIGARVEILQAFDNLVSTSEFEPLFTGVVAERDRMNLDGITLHCVEDRSWNTMLPPRTVTVEEFEDAPAGVKGVALPIVLGDWESRNRYLDGAGDTHEAVYAGLARGACPMLPISSPTGSTLTLPKHLISDDEIDQGVLSGGAPYDQWYMYENALDVLVGPGLGTLDNPTDGPATTVLQSTQVTCAIIPVEKNAGTTGDDAEYCLRKDKPRNLGPGFSYVDFDSFRRILRWDLPDVAPLGTFISATLRVYYQKPATSGTAPKFIVQNQVSVTATVGSFSHADTGYVSDGFEAVATVAVAATEIADWADIKNCYLQCDVRAAGQEMKIHHVVLNVHYIAFARTERPGTQRDENTGRTVNVAGRTQGGGRVWAPFVRQVTSPDLVSFDSTLYGFPRGRKDTAAGIYTGTPDDLIENPVDMVRYLLRRWCGVSAGEIVENSGDFGSFLDAKAAISSYRFRTIISNRTEAEDHIAAIGAEALIWFKRCPTIANAPWVAVPWELGSPVNYRSTAEPFTFYRARNHVVEGSFSVGETRISLVANTVRVNYDWDPRTNTYGDQLYITPTSSRIHFIGDLFGADSGREAEAAASAALYGGTRATSRELVVSLKMVNNPTTATAIMSRLFDLRVTTKLVVRFHTYVNAYDLNRGHVIEFAADWDDRLAYPKPGTDGSWAGKAFRVTGVKRLAESPAEYAVEAVEV